MTVSISTSAVPVIADRDENGDRLLEALQGIVPKLRERAGKAEAARRIPEETVNELRDMGAFRAVVPKRYGGMELPYPYIPQVFRILGRGCSSTGWAMGFLVFHNAQFGHFPLEAQEEVWGTRPGYTMAPGQVVPSGTAKQVKGGFEVSGRWGYATGINHGDWMLFSTLTEMQDGSKQVRRFYAPVTSFDVLDTWDTVSMKATGSHDVTLDKEFIPEHRSIPADDMRNFNSVGLGHNAGPLWKMPLVSYMVLGGVGPFIGAAEALLEIVTDVMKVKVGAYTGERQQGLMSQQMRIGRMAMDLDTVVRFWEGHTEDLWEEVKSGKEISLERRQEITAVAGHVGAKCYEIVNELAGAVGTRSYFSDSPIQRFHRDMASLSTHAMFEHDRLTNTYGSLRLGMELPQKAMV